MTFNYTKVHTERCGDEDFVRDEEQLEYTPNCQEMAKALASFVSDTYGVEYSKGLVKFIFDYDLEETMLNDKETVEYVKDYFEDKAE